MGSHLETWNFPPRNGQPHPFTGPAWVEDFEYGYPYRNMTLYPQYGQLAVTPVEFEYSTTERTSLGVKTSSSYRRRDWSLQRFDPGTDPNNYDRGYYARAPYGTANTYLLWPLMTWGETQIMTVTVRTDNYAACIWLHAFDGHYGDKFHAFLNGKWWGTIEDSQAHGWTGEQIWLPPGLNRIAWIFEAAQAVPTKATSGITTGGVANPVTTPPALLRHLRMANLAVTKVTRLPVSKTDYANIQATSSFGSKGTVIRNSGPVSMNITGNFGNQQKTGLAYMSGVFTLVTNANIVKNQSGFVEMQGVGTLSSTTSVKADHAAEDGGWHLSSEGQVRVETPIDKHQNRIVRPLQLVTPTMRTPTFIQGRPMHPAYVNVATSTSSSNSTFAYVDPVGPTDVNRPLPVPPTYRWVATDLTGADGAQVPSWPCRTAGGPAWTSSDWFQPTQHQHTHFAANGNFGQGEYVTYSRAVHFDNEMCEHMWLSMPVGNRVSNYTWQIVAILGPALADRWNHILDAGPGTATPLDEISIRNGQHIAVAGENLNPRCAIIKTNDTYILQTATTPVPAGKWHLMFHGPEITTRPMIITASLQGASPSTTLAINSNAYVGRQNYGQNATTPVGYLLGRTYGWCDQWAGSSMSILEMSYWNRPLSSVEWNKNVAYYASLYQFNQYR